jgi:DNA-binding transcriptional LysR family regulator
MIDDLRSPECLFGVLAIHRAGSPVKAAKDLGWAPSTIYRAIERLEKAVGAPVFERAQTGWMPTEIGRRLIRLAEKIEVEVLETEVFLLGRNKHFPAPLRISASDGFAEGYLAPILAEFAQHTPDVTIEIIVDNQFSDLARRQAEIAIRPDQRPGEGLVGRRAGKLAHALYGATALFKTGDRPASVDDLSGFKVCMLSAALDRHTSATWWRHGIRKEVDISFVANTEMALAAAIAAGAGIGVLPCFLGDRLDGVERLTIAVGPPVDIWLVTHSGLRSNPLVRTLIRALASAMKRDAAMLAGGLA